jgi:uncharacterized repeat protein (TIGR01451 family)
MRFRVFVASRKQTGKSPSPRAIDVTTSREHLVNLNQKSLRDLMQTFAAPNFFRPRATTGKRAAVRFFTALVFGLAALALAMDAAHAAPEAKSPLATELALSRIVVGDDGKELVLPAARVQPGDTLRYSAAYRNQGKTALNDVVASLPVPQGMQMAPAQADKTQADDMQASVDGKTFTRLPLVRRVRQADGRWADVPVPLAEIRYVRWAARTLAAGEQFNASLRVRVTPAGQ